MSKFKKLLDDLNIISKLGDNPGTDNGLTAAGLKAKFDEAGLIIQKFINDIVDVLNTELADDGPLYSIVNNSQAATSAANTAAASAATATAAANEAANRANTAADTIDTKIAQKVDRDAANSVEFMLGYDAGGLYVVTD